MLSIDVSISKKTTWGYDTDVLIMRVVHQAVTTSAVSAIDRILAKHNTRMMSSVSRDLLKLPVHSMLSNPKFHSHTEQCHRDGERCIKIPYHIVRYRATTQLRTKQQCSTKTALYGRKSLQWKAWKEGNTILVYTFFIELWYFERRTREKRNIWDMQWYSSPENTFLFYCGTKYYMYILEISLQSPKHVSYHHIVCTVTTLRHCSLTEPQWTRNRQCLAECDFTIFLRQYIGFENSH